MKIEDVIFELRILKSDAERNVLTDLINRYEHIIAWLKILKSAQFEYNEAFRIMTSPTPDVTDNDRTRAVIVLDVFRDSLGRIEQC